MGVSFYLGYRWLCHNMDRIAATPLRVSVYSQCEARPIGIAFRPAVQAPLMRQKRQGRPAPLRIGHTRKAHTARKRKAAPHAARRAKLRYTSGTVSAILRLRAYRACQRPGKARQRPGKARKLARHAPARPAIDRALQARKTARVMARAAHATPPLWGQYRLGLVGLPTP